MKKSFQIAAVFAAFLLGTSSLCLAQGGIIVGGFGRASTTDEQVVKAANFAILEENKQRRNIPLELVSIVKAEQQIVAGINYRLCLSVLSAGKPEQVSATVYRDLKNQYSLSAWKPGPCGDIQAAISLAPDALVKSLYSAEKAGVNPFFQKEDRSLVDKFFAKDFADLIWNDAVSSDGEVGALDFDPLYNAQDTKITKFLIGKPAYAKKSGAATVLVSFRNFGKAETVKFLLVKEDFKSWKITDVIYRGGSRLKDIFSNSDTPTPTQDL
jgi:hypothetical protein